MPTGLTRHQLARQLGISAATVDRMRASGLLKPVTRRGQQPLYRLADGRKAQQAAAARPETAATIRWLSSMAHEAASHEYRLRTEWVHQQEWVVSWLVAVRQVRALMEQWANLTVPVVLQLLRDPRVHPGGPVDARRLGVLAQTEVSTPLLDQIAELEWAWPEPPARPAELPLPSSITEARQRLVHCRTQWTQLRVRVQTEPGWSRRAVLSAQRDDAREKAKATIWTALPGKLIAVAVHQLPDEEAVWQLLRRVGQDVVQELALLVRPGRGYTDEDEDLAAGNGRRPSAAVEDVEEEEPDDVGHGD
jgi:hypothetical protein